MIPIKSEEEIKNLKEDQFDDTIQLRFVAGGRIPLLDTEDAEKHSLEITQQIRDKIRPLQQRLIDEIKSIGKSDPKLRDIEKTERMGKISGWIEISQGEFVRYFKKDKEENPPFMQFLEEWCLHMPRPYKEEAEVVMNTIQDVINDYTLSHKQELKADIEFLLDADPL